MSLQLLVVLLFALNLALVWLAGKYTWYRPFGALLFALLPLVTVLLEQPRFELDFFWWRWAGVLAIVLGAGLLIWAQRSAGRAITGLADILPDFTDQGPYRFFRHPMYLGLILIWVGWWWVWAAVHAFYFGMFILAETWIAALLEEKLVMEKQFGQRYRDYKRVTGMFWVK